MTKKIVVTRRQMLRGLGGFSLGLPFLPSLVSNAAHAQVVFQGPRRFVGLTSGHGGILTGATYPGDPAQSAVTTQNVVDTYSVRRSALVRSVSGTDATLSTIYTAPADELTPALVAKFNLLRSVTIPWYIAHNTGGHFGNFARNDGNGDDGQFAHPFKTPTIDQVMAHSPSFYSTSDLLSTVLRSVNLGTEGGFSWGFRNPQDPVAGDVVEQGSFVSPRTAFEELYVPPPNTQNPEPQRAPLVDLILDRYRSLRQSNRRLSASDRLRLDAHVARLDELQRRLDVIAPVAECRLLDPPHQGHDFYPSGDEFAALQHAYNDVIAMAFACGTTRIATMPLMENLYVPEESDWHAIAHAHAPPGPQQQLQRAMRSAFRHGFLDLVRKLDVEESPGVTVLDNSLVSWTWECGAVTHDSVEVPILMAGSAAGFFNTGQYCDYRDLARGADEARPGLPHNQWLATVLQAMGVPPSEFNAIPNCGFKRIEPLPPVTGYGFVQDLSFGDFPGARPGTLAAMNDILPFLRAQGG